MLFDLRNERKMFRANAKPRVAGGVEGFDRGRAGGDNSSVEFVAGANRIKCRRCAQSRRRASFEGEPVHRRALFGRDNCLRSPGLAGSAAIVCSRPPLAAMPARGRACASRHKARAARHRDHHWILSKRVVAIAISGVVLPVTPPGLAG
jgi:hypothetical protein